MRTMTAIAAAGLAVLAATGCAYSTRSGLPAHVQTIEVPTFRNSKTLYKGLEARLTRRVKELVNEDPNVRVVNHGGDASLIGEITDVQKDVPRETKQDRPASVRLTIQAVVSFFDEVEQRPIVQDLRISSREGSEVAGLYEQDRGEVRASAEDAAIDALAREIVRRTLGRW